jgi:hypothetical protein
MGQSAAFLWIAEDLGRCASAEDERRSADLPLSAQEMPHRNLTLGPLNWKPKMTWSRGWGRQCGDAVSSKRWAPARTQGGAGVRIVEDRGYRAAGKPFRGPAINA